MAVPARNLSSAPATCVEGQLPPGVSSFERPPRPSGWRRPRRQFPGALLPDPQNDPTALPHQPGLQYTDERFVGCEPGEFATWRTAQLTLHGLPAFACVRREDFTAVMHEAPRVASEGPLFHTGWTDEDSAPMPASSFGMTALAPGA